MSESKVAKRYAKSLISLSSEKHVMDAVNADMKLFVGVCRENRDLSLLLNNPIIHADKKRAILQNVFGAKMNELTMAFFDIVIRKSRERYLEQIAAEFTAFYKQLKGIRTAEVISAVGLDESLRQKVYDMVRSGSADQVELVEKVDSKLIGGFVLRMGDRQYDASIASELRKLAREFSSNPYIKKN